MDSSCPDVFLGVVLLCANTLKYYYCLSKIYPFQGTGAEQSSCHSSQPTRELASFSIPHVHVYTYSDDPFHLLIMNAPEGAVLHPLNTELQLPRLSHTAVTQLIRSLLSLNVKVGWMLQVTFSHPGQRLSMFEQCGTLAQGQHQGAACRVSGHLLELGARELRRLRSTRAS